MLLISALSALFFSAFAVVITSVVVMLLKQLLLRNAPEAGFLPWYLLYFDKLHKVPRKRT